MSAPGTARPDPVPDAAEAPASTTATPDRPAMLAASPGQVIAPPGRRAVTTTPAEPRPTRAAAPERQAGTASRASATPTVDFTAIGRRAEQARAAVRGFSLGRSTGRTSGSRLKLALAAASRWKPFPRTRQAIRRIGIGRALCWQLSAVALLTTLGTSRAVTIATVVGVASVVASTTIRIHGKLLYEWLFRAGRYLLRARQATLAPGPQSAQDLVDLVAQHTSVETVDLDEMTIAFIHQPAGIAAVLELHELEEPGYPAGLKLTSPAPLLPPPDSMSPRYAAQMIMQISPPPDLSVLSGDTSRPQQRAWITLQAIRTADAYTDADLGASLGTAVQRLLRRLVREELPTRTLDRDEALTLITALSQLDSIAAGVTPAPASESWGAMSVGSTTQACFRIDGWLDTDEMARQLVLRRIQLIPSRGTTVAIAARRKERRSDTECHVIVRITEANRPLLDNSANLLAFALDDLHGLKLERLNGDHLAAVAGSLPLGAQTALR